MGVKQSHLTREFLGSSTLAPQRCIRRLGSDIIRARSAYIINRARTTGVEEPERSFRHFHAVLRLRVRSSVLCMLPLFCTLPNLKLFPEHRCGSELRES